MLREIALPQAYRVTPTGLYLISTAYQGKRNVQFAFRALGISDEPALTPYRHSGQKFQPRGDSEKRRIRRQRLLGKAAFCR